MKMLCYVWALVLGAGFSARAQQLLCERDLVSLLPSGSFPAALLRLQPDTLHLLTYATLTGNFNTPLQQRIRLHRLNTAQCDTLLPQSAPPSLLNSTGGLLVTGTNRQGQVLTVEGQYPRANTFDSARTVLRLLNRNGSQRWQHLLAVGEGVSDILEAPENGFFLVGEENHPASPPIRYDLIIRLDSTGRELWHRRYQQIPHMDLQNPVYTRSGTFVCTATYGIPGQAPHLTLREFNQRGDSLQTRHLLIEPQQETYLHTLSNHSLVPLRDGGFALIGRVDSASTGYYRPFLTRLDPQGNVTWRYVFRRSPLVYYRFDQPRELADGSLLVVVSNGLTARNQPYWLYRFSASGQLIATYPFLSQVLPPYNTSARYFQRVVGLQAFSDSTLMLAATASDLTASHTYLAHLRVPGLPRLLNNHVVPAADPLATRPPQAAAPWPGAAAYPNPTATTLTVPYHRPAGARALVLRVCDALGRTVLTQPLPPGAEALTLDVRPWAPGLYLLTLEADGRPLARQRVAVLR